MNQLVKSINTDAIVAALMQGDLGKLNPEQQLSYYNQLCTSLSLNPLTKPFEYMILNGKKVLYAGKGCAEQLRAVHKVSVKITARETMEGVYVVTADASLPDGRVDSATGAVAIAHLKGEPLANAFMKAETKAKRRVTLSIVGLNMLDEIEVDSIKDAKPANPTGDLLAAPAAGHPTPLISDEQRKDLFQKAQDAGWTEPDIKAVMRSRFKIEFTKDLTQKELDILTREMAENPKKKVLVGVNAPIGTADQFSTPPRQYVLEASELFADLNGKAIGECSTESLQGFHEYLSTITAENPPPKGMIKLLEMKKKIEKFLQAGVAV